MPKITDITTSIAVKRKKELVSFLYELDEIMDKLYNRVDYNGVFECIMSLEDVRIQYYTELYEQNKILSLKGKQNGR